MQVNAVASKMLGERYLLSKVRAEGAYGIVYEARDTLLGRTVAVKHLRRLEGDATQADYQDFVSEAQTLARVKHPHVVEIYDIGWCAEQRPYFVMELVQQSLEDVLEREGTLSVERTLSTLLPVAGALSSVHDAGLTHLDIKPANIAIEVLPGGKMRAKLLDFGIARPHGTATGAWVRGTPSYMAPEQARGEACGPATDVWALAIVMYRCLSGVLPFGEDEPSNVLHRVLEQRARDIRGLVPTLPTNVALALDRALEPQRELRYTDARELARGLLMAAGASGLKVVRDPDPIGLPDAPIWLGGGQSSRTQPQLLAVPAIRRRARGGPVILAVLAAVILIGLLFQVRPWRSPAVMAKPTPPLLPAPPVPNQSPAGQPSAAPARPSAIASQPTTGEPATNDSRAPKVGSSRRVARGRGRSLRAGQPSASTTSAPSAQPAPVVEHAPPPELELKREWGW